MTLDTLMEKEETLGKKKIEIDPRITVAHGLHQESKISLHNAGFELTKYAAAIIYPSCLILAAEKLENADSRYDYITKDLAKNVFKDLSPEELKIHFFKKISPLQSLFDYEHSIEKLRVTSHLFDPEAIDYLIAEIKAL